MVGLTENPGEGPRLQDLVAGDLLEVTVHEGFDYWVADLDDEDGSMAAALEQANEAAAPTAGRRRRRGVLDRARRREFLRWVLPRTRTACSTPWPGCTPRTPSSWSRAAA